MKKYEAPIVIINDDVSEGVYTASGWCWTVDAESVQDWSGAYHVFEIKCVHSESVEHISTATTIQLVFNNELTGAYTESDFSCTWSGNTVTLVRESHANGYVAGDIATLKVWVQTGDEAETRALACISSDISCTWTENVQGLGGDGS